MCFCINEFEVGINNSIFSGNEQQKVYFYESHCSLTKKDQKSYFKFLGFLWFESLYRYILKILSLVLVLFLLQLGFSL